MRPATRRRLVLCRREWELEAPDWNAQGAIADGLWEREGWYGRYGRYCTAEDSTRGQILVGARTEDGRGRREARGSRAKAGARIRMRVMARMRGRVEGVSVRCRRGWFVTIDRSQVGLCLLLWGSKGSKGRTRQGCLVEAAVAERSGGQGREGLGRQEKSLRCQSSELQERFGIGLGMRRRRCRCRRRCRLLVLVVGAGCWCW